MRKITKLVSIITLAAAATGCATTQAAEQASCNPDELNLVHETSFIFEREGQFSTATWTAMDTLPEDCNAAEIVYVGSPTTGGLWTTVGQEAATKAGIEYAQQEMARQGWKLYTGR